MNSEIITKDEKLKVIKTIMKFDNLKCNYFLIKLFNIIKKKKSFEIIKYNKKLQNRLNLSVKDYKEYSQLYSSIEIELKLVDNKFDEVYDNFINIREKKNKEYYHIFFDNSKEEIKRYNLKENEGVKTIKIIIDHQVESFYELFNNCCNISSIFFKKFNRTNIYDMCGMFSGCSSLKELNLSNFNTNNVTNMSWMFNGCSSLKELNLSNFNTGKVTDMYCMFNYCKSLEELDLSNFNTNNVTIMGSTFAYCDSLKKLNLFNFNTSNVTSMSFMFFHCLSLNELIFSNFNTDKVEDMSFMFNGCPSELKKKVKEKNKHYLKI